MLIRREKPSDISAISDVHAAAFAVTPEGRNGPEPREAKLVDELRAGPDWLEKLSLVAVVDGVVVGHVCCSRGRLDGGLSALGLGPLGLLPEHQGRGGGKALMHAVLGAAVALDEPLVLLLGSPDYYRQFGFVRSTELGIQPPDESWGGNFMARRLLDSGAGLSGRFSYTGAFDRV